MIDRHGLQGDEFITLGVMENSYSELMNERFSQSHVPLYFLLQKIWTTVFGFSEAALRSLGVVFGWLAVWSTGRLARRLGGLRLGVPVIFAVTLHQGWLSSSLEARMYSMLIWATAESTDAWFAWARSCRDADRRRSRLCLTRWTLVSIFALHVHLLYGVVMAFHVGDALLRRWRHALPVGPFVSGVLFTLFACSPVTVQWWHHQTKFDGPPVFDLGLPKVLIVQAASLLWGGGFYFAPPLLRLAAGLLTLSACAGLLGLLAGPWTVRHRPFVEGPEGRRDLLALAWACPLFVGGLLMAQMYSSDPILSADRYYAVLRPGVIILGFAGLAFAGPRLSRFGLLLIPATLLVLGAPGVHYLRESGSGFRESVEIIQADLPPGRGVVTLMGGKLRIGLDYYDRRGARRENLHLIPLVDGEARIRDRLAVYTRDHPEFWVFVYRQDFETLRQVLENPPNGYEAVNSCRFLGGSRLQLFRRESTGSATSDAAMKLAYGT